MISKPTINAVAKNRTWVYTATTCGTNHYTTTANSVRELDICTIVPILSIYICFIKLYHPHTRRLPTPWQPANLIVSRLTTYLYSTNMGIYTSTVHAPIGTLR